MNHTTKDKEFYRRIGSLGGRATVQRHGSEHMRQIGQRGFQSTTDKYFRNERHHKQWLAEMGAYTYWQQTNLPMRYGRNGEPIFPPIRPTHPAHPDHTEF